MAIRHHLALPVFQVIANPKSTSYVLGRRAIRAVWNALGDVAAWPWGFATVLPCPCSTALLIHSGSCCGA